MNNAQTIAIMASVIWAAHKGKMSYKEAVYEAKEILAEAMGL